MRESLSILTAGGVIIYPTDTIYGIGCDATDENAVLRIRRIKKRDEKPFSVIAPSKKWIEDNCELNDASKEWIDKLPGPYTLIVRLKKQCVAPSVNFESGTLGIRIPAHWISDKVAELDRPLVTTSVNVTGEPFATKIQDIADEIIQQVDLVLDDGESSGRPSTLVDCTGKEAIVRTR